MRDRVGWAEANPPGCRQAATPQASPVRHGAGWENRKEIGGEDSTPRRYNNARTHSIHGPNRHNLPVELAHERT